MRIFKSKTLFFISILIIFCVFAWYIREMKLMGDEKDYYLSISEIIHGRINSLTFARDSVLPGYVLILGILSLFTGNFSQITVRVLTMIISFLSVVVFYLLAKKINKKYSFVKTLQYLVSPLFFPFFFLIYSDMVSLFFVLTSLFFLLSKKYAISGLFALISLAIRQDNIFWVGLFLVYVYLDKKSFKPFLKSAFIYFFSFVLFFLFFIFNGYSFALAGKNYHVLSVHSGNVFLFLLILFFIFFPLQILSTRKILLFIRRRPWIFIIILLINLSLFNLKLDNGLNQPIHDYFLRNRLMHNLLATTQNKLIGYSIAVWSTLTLSVTVMWQKRFYAAYPFFFLSLILHWLIEPRYLFVPVALFMLFRREESMLVEYYITFVSVSITMIIIAGMYTGVFFP